MQLKKGTKKTKATIGSPMQKGFKSLKKDINQLDTKIDIGLSRLDAKINNLDAKIDGVETRLDAKINGLDAKIDGVETRLDSKINGLDIKIDSVEKRLDAKIDFSTQSMKDYTDSKFNQVMIRFDVMQNNFDKLNGKLDVSVKGIVEMIERSFGSQAKIEDHVQDHERRITLLESNN